jgi:hypothetical protein
MQDIYFETLGKALDSFSDYLAKNRAVTLATQSDMAMAFNGGVSYEQTVSRSFEIATLKDKTTRRYAHITLYRMKSGKYELTNYIL